MNFLVGIILGIVISSIGFAGVAKLLDYAVVKVQTVAKDATKE